MTAQVEELKDIEQLFKQYRDKCYGFFIKMLHDPHLAKDLTQDVFISLIENKRTSDKLSNPDHYIYTLCRNRAYNHLKRANYDKEYRDHLFRYWNQSSNMQRPNAIQRKIDAEHYHTILEESLENLPPQQQLIFNMSHREGLSYQKIAEKLEISPLTVRNHLHRALKTIRSTTHPDIELILVITFFFL